MKSGRPLSVLRTIALGLWLVFAVAAAAEERIIEFNSDIQIHADRTMTVIESITVKAEGKQIRRGIYRDFPTDYRDALGNRYRVAFDVQSVLRDGLSEPYKTERINNGVRVYIGQSDRFLPAGEYRYQITYETDRQLGFFAEHDELYWNVTGTGWNFHIDKATATIKLPSAVDPSELKTDAYTGPEGSRDKHFTAYIDDLGVAHFETNYKLRPHEGLTVVLAWPKSVIQPPKTSERVAATLLDNAHVLIAVIGSLGLALFYFFTWDRVGRDPAPGIVVAEYEPPPGYSPASMRYIEKMSYDDKCLSAAIINLAVKGYLNIEETKKRYLLHKTGNDVELAPGEKALVNKLFRAKQSIELKQSNHKTISDALDAHEQALSADYENKYFKTNRKFFFIGAALSVILIVLTAIVATSRGGFHETFFMATWSSIWWFVTGAGLIKAWNSIRHAPQRIHAVHGADSNIVPGTVCRRRRGRTVYVWQRGQLVHHYLFIIRHCVKYRVLSITESPDDAGKKITRQSCRLPALRRYCRKTRARLSQSSRPHPSVVREVFAVCTRAGYRTTMDRTIS